jgi:hypothetical protein
MLMGSAREGRTPEKQQAFRTKDPGGRAAFHERIRSTMTGLRWVFRIKEK